MDFTHAKASPPPNKKDWVKEDKGTKSTNFQLCSKISHGDVKKKIMAFFILPFMIIPPVRHVLSDYTLV